MDPAPSPHGLADLRQDRGRRLLGYAHVQPPSEHRDPEEHRDADRRHHRQRGGGVAGLWAPERLHPVGDRLDACERGRSRAERPQDQEQREGGDLLEREVGGGSSGAPVIGWLITDMWRLPLRPGETILGREGEGVVALPSPSVSRQHAALTIDGTAVRLRDLGSNPWQVATAAD